MMRFLRRMAIVGLLASGLVAITPVRSAAAPTADDVLFSGPPGDSAGPDSPGVLRRREFLVDSKAIAAAVVAGGAASAQAASSGDAPTPLAPVAATLELFDGEQRHFEPVEATAQRAVSDTGTSARAAAEPTIAWYAEQRSGDDVEAFATLTLTPDGIGGYQVLAVISDGTDTYRVEPVAGDLHSMVELDPLFSPGPPGEKDVLPAPPSSTDSPAGSPDLGAAAASNPPTIDVLVAYVSTVPNAVTRIQQAMNRDEPGVHQQRRPGPTGQPRCIRFRGLHAGPNRYGDRPDPSTANE